MTSRGIHGDAFTGPAAGQADLAGGARPGSNSMMPPLPLHPLQSVNVWEIRAGCQFGTSKITHTLWSAKLIDTLPTARCAETISDGQVMM